MKMGSVPNVVETTLSSRSNEISKYTFEEASRIDYKLDSYLLHFGLFSRYYQSGFHR